MNGMKRKSNRQIPAITPGAEKVPHDLEDIVASVTRLNGVRKADLGPGDQVLIATHNSIYSIRVLNETSYLVSGGWFDAKSLSPARTTIEGCSWDGSAIKVDWVAAPGLRVVFGNHAVTSTVKKVWVFRYGMLN